MSAAKTGAQRQAALRSKGRQVSVVLRNPEAIVALDALAAECGGVTAAITRALVAAGSTGRGTEAWQRWQEDQMERAA